jgi:dUTP pyrophosphatase
MKVKVKKLTPTARLPEYATDGSGAFDLFAPEAEQALPGLSTRIQIGLSFEIPEGHAMFVYSRSGHALKNRVRLTNCVAVIDSDYRGEVAVMLSNEGPGILDIRAGDRIAQAVILPIPRIEFVEVDELSETERGAGGFGSTGS